MVKISSLILVILIGENVLAQTKIDLQIVVETEKSFAKAAEAKGIKLAFLEYLYKIFLFPNFNLNSQ